MAKKIKRPDKVTLNVQIPKDLHDEFKMYAIKFGEPMRFYVQRAIQELVTRNARDELQKVRVSMNSACDHKGHPQYSTQGQDFCGNCSQPLT